jgi:hypothetical protein
MAGWLSTLPARGNPAPAAVLCARLRAAPPGATGGHGAAQGRGDHGAGRHRGRPGRSDQDPGDTDRRPGGRSPQRVYLYVPSPRRYVARGPAAGRDRRLPVPVPPTPGRWPPSPGSRRSPAAPAATSPTRTSWRSWPPPRLRSRVRRARSCAAKARIPATPWSRGRLATPGRWPRQSQAKSAHCRLHHLGGDLAHRTTSALSLDWPSLQFVACLRVT